MLQNADREGPEGRSAFSITSYMQVDDPQYNSGGTQVGVTQRQIPRWKETVTLTPTAQTLFDQQQAVKQRMNEVALSQANRLNELIGGSLTFDHLSPGAGKLSAPALVRGTVQAPTLQTDVGPNDFSADKSAHMAAIMDRLEYQANLARERMVVKLRNSGIRAGMRAYDEELYAFDKQTTDARIQAFAAAGQEQSRMFGIALQKATFRNEAANMAMQHRIMIIDIPNKVALQQFQLTREAAVFAEALRERGRTELLLLRTNPTNEVSALMRGGMVPVPQPQGFRQGHISDTPLAQSVYNSAALDMQKWQVQTQQHQQMMGGLMSLGGSLLTAPMTGGTSILGMGMQKWMGGS